MPATAIFRPVYIPLLLAGLTLLVQPGCGRSVDRDETSPSLPGATALVDETASKPPSQPAPEPASQAASQPASEPLSEPSTKDMSADDPADPPIETTAEVAEASGRYEARHSPDQRDSPREQPQGQPALESTQGKAASSPELVPTAGAAEMEPQGPLPGTNGARRVASNPLRPGVPAGVESVESDSARASETESHGDESGDASSPDDEEDEPFDPIKVNGEIFVDWPKPRLALMISGRQDGYLEPCGCAGLDRMKGGLSRRHSLIKDLRQKRGWEVVGLDVGGITKEFGRQAELKFQIAVNAFRQMEYRAIGLGKNDLKNQATELLSVVFGEESPFHSANVGVFGFDTGFTNTYKIVEAGGLKLGITSILGDSWQGEVNNSDIELADPETKLTEVLPKLEDCDVLILLAHATKEESENLAKKFPAFDIVVTAGGAEEPPHRVAKVAEDTMFVEVGTKGMNVIVLGLFDDPKTPYRDQRVPLDSRFAESADIRDLMIQYQQQLQADGFAGLGIRKSPHHQSKTLGRFVGSKRCEPCHEESYKVWKKTGHAKAFETLAQTPVPRQFDPECLSCHVVGWNPQKHFPYETGFWSFADTPNLTGVGCENCHGPGEKHIDAEEGGDLALQEKLQEEMTVSVDEARDRATSLCFTCHDIDNSPDFEFEEYWPQIEHHDD